MEALVAYLEISSDADVGKYRRVELNTVTGRGEAPNDISIRCAGSYAEGKHGDSDSAIEDVLTRASVERIAAVAAVERVIAAAALEKVVTRQAGYRVVASKTIDRVVAIGAGQ